MEMQLARYRAALAGGMSRCGWKVGINVPEVLGHLELNHPGVGWLNGTRLLEGGAQFAPAPGVRLMVEAELGIRLRAGLASDADPATARAAIESVAPALELVDYAKPSSGLDDVVGHSMFHEAAVIGPPGPLDAAVGLGDRLPMLSVPGQDVPRPRTDLVPADLGELLVFVAGFLAAFDEELCAGDLLLSGSYTAAALPLAPGSGATADFGDLGSVSVKIAE